MSLIRKHVAVLQAWACLALVKCRHDSEYLHLNWLTFTAFNFVLAKAPCVLCMCLIFCAGERMNEDGH